MMAIAMVGNLALHLYEVYELGLHVYGLSKKISFSVNGMSTFQTS